jgi:hypothetical protein
MRRVVSRPGEGRSITDPRDPAKPRYERSNGNQHRHRRENQSGTRIPGPIHSANLHGPRLIPRSAL